MSLAAYVLIGPGRAPGPIQGQALGIFQLQRMSQPPVVRDAERASGTGGRRAAGAMN